MLSDGNMTKPVNLAGGLTMGIEASMYVKPLKFLQADFRATLQSAENRSRLYNYCGKRLPDEPDFSGLGKITLGPFKDVEVGYWLD